MARNKKKKGRLQGAHVLAAQNPDTAVQPQSSKPEKKQAAASPYHRPYSKRSIWTLMAFALLITAVPGVADWFRGASISNYPLLGLPVDCLGTALFLGGLGILVVGKPVHRMVKEERSLRLMEMLALAVIWSVVSFLFYSSILVSMGPSINPLLNPQPNYVTAFFLANLICIWIMNLIYRHLPPSIYGKTN